MDYSKYLEIFKIFKLKGNPYIFVVNDTMFAYDEGFGSISYIKLSPLDILPLGHFIACRLKDFEDYNPNIENIRLYNHIVALNARYFSEGNGFFLLDDNMSDIIYTMKSSDNAIIQRYHLEDDINKDYLLSLTYGMFPLSKGDEVDNYIKLWNNGLELLMKSIVHKKKQKIDITILHKFLLI